MSKHRILITGGLGYVGGRIAKHLAADPELALQLTSRNVNAHKPDWLINGEIVQWDIAADADLTRLCAGVDTVVHLAALNEIDSANDPVAALGRREFVVGRAPQPAFALLLGLWASVALAQSGRRRSNSSSP